MKSTQEIPMPPMDTFLHAFADELTKEAGDHPLFSSVVKGGTLLGQKVKGMVSRATKAGAKALRRGAKAKKVGVKGAKMVIKKAGLFGNDDDEDEKKDDEEGGDEGGGEGGSISADQAGEMLRAMMSESQQSYGNGYPQDGVDQVGTDDAPLYGSGGGPKKDPPKKAARPPVSMPAPKARAKPVSMPSPQAPKPPAARSPAKVQTSKPPQKGFMAASRQGVSSSMKSATPDTRAKKPEFNYNARLQTPSIPSALADTRQKMQR